MKRILFILFLTLIITVNYQCKTGEVNTTFETDTFLIEIDDQGAIISLFDKDSGNDYAVEGNFSSLLAIKAGDSIIKPKTVITAENGLLILSFDDGIDASVQVLEKSKYLTFELVEISNESTIDALIWGPYNASLNKSIGETVGIVQGEDFTIGIQGLNLKTLGGYPWNDHDHMPQMNIFEQDDIEDMETRKGFALYSVEAARPKHFGSSLQAFTRNRSEDRVIENLRHDRFVAPAYNDGGLVGSKIALFGCANEQTLKTIGTIELEEGLPHPIVDGTWIKESPLTNSAYLIMGFGEDTIERSLDIVEASGLGYLYHSDPFETWGQYEPKSYFFPNSYEGLRECVEKAEARGIKLGVHTLSNFINTKDSYVSPIPDKRLAKVGSSTLVKAIDAQQKDIEIASPDFFNQFENNHLKSVVVGDELIRYGSVSETAPWKLLDCQRGAFGTTATAHNQETSISKLLDHGYKVFLTNTELSKEVAVNIAKVFNETGVRMLDFDGLEGNLSTGMGNYGEALFAKTWYDNLNDDIKSHFLLGASRPGHYFWHMYSRMNWGEPWYAGFRESQTEYRLKNQAYYKRNLMPGMLGWFNMTPTTSVEDIEWMLTRSAAYNAGYAFVTGFKVLEENGQASEVLRLLGVWEKARLKGAFSEAHEKRMQDSSTEFHLETIDENSWNLNQVFSHKFQHEKKIRQPGEPLYSTFEFKNEQEPQELQFLITAVDGDVSKMELEINGFNRIELPLILKKGHTLKHVSGNKIRVYDANWNVLKELELEGAEFKIEKGDQRITLDCQFDSGESPKVKMEIRVHGNKEKISI